jgi:hypothetical protein
MAIFEDHDDGSGALGFDEDVADEFDVVAVLDSEAAIAARDPGRLLWTLATAGAQVRAAVSQADGWRTAALSSDDPPRAVLVATDTAADAAAGLLAELGADRSAVIEWIRPGLPRWAGPADVLLAASIDGRHPRIARLVADAQRRGLVVVVVAPDDTPVAAATGRGTHVAIEDPQTRRGALWTLMTPLLLAGAAVGAVDLADAAFDELADALDKVAELARPGSDAFSNATKQLAVELVESEGVIAGIGPFSALAARCFSNSLALFAGVTAVPLALPDDVTRAGALLDIPLGGAGGTTEDPDDFFRDRVAVAPRRRRLIFLSDVAEGEVSVRAEWREIVHDELAHAGDLAAIALGHLAASRRIIATTVELPARAPLARFAAAVAFGHFTAAYAAIGRDIDPTAARAGELPH